MKNLIKKQEDRIQADLDNGKFGMICSNESTFKKYVFEFLKKVRKESIKFERERILKIIRKDISESYKKRGKEADYEDILIKIIKPIE